MRFSIGALKRWGSQESETKRARASANSSPDLGKALSIDLEINPKTQVIYALAAVHSHSGEALQFSSGRQSVSQSLGQIDEAARDVQFILGHNIVHFDLPHMQATLPDLDMYKLPVVDTLMLNPLAFPRNPYHHLVKHYQDGQIVRSHRNDPELDARIALNLFQDQLHALSLVPADLMKAWHWLTADSFNRGFDRVFEHIRKLPAPSDEEGRSAIRHQLSGQCCDQALKSVMDKSPGWPLAYALAWISVAGSNSVMPPWVRHQFPEAKEMVRLLRDSSCGKESCEWCITHHNAVKELKRWFGFDSYRPEPEIDGKSMQQAIVESAINGENLLAILPTGTGKSVCYQVPALSQYNKTGRLTVVISPLVALMADQIQGLQEQGVRSAVTINSMMSMPERADALDRVRLGDASILIISPEQLRSRSIRGILKQRDISTWVLDEAHCLSKWGHDFRPDYTYIGRFIREHHGAESLPQVICLTATAKPAVKAEILEHFREHLVPRPLDVDTSRSIHSFGSG